MTNTGSLPSAFENKKQVLLEEVQNYGLQKTQRLSKVNQGFNISFTVAGLTCTALTTVLGVINNPNYEGWINFSVALTGATAVASQAASREFRVRGKAGNYIEAEAKRAIIESQIKRSTELDEIKKLENDFDNLQIKVGSLEKEANNPD